MWRTPLGVRTLSGAEGAVVARAVSEIFYELDASVKDDCLWRADHPSIDNLDLEQKVVLLADVARALLRSSVPAPQLTAVNEAMVNAIYRRALGMIEEEIDFAKRVPRRSRGRVRYRTKVVQAARAISPPDDSADVGADDPYRMPKPTCTNMETWEFVIDVLSDRVLHDADWEAGNPIEQVVLDLPPEIVARDFSWIGVERAYFSAIVPIPTEKQFESARRVLVRLANELD